MKKCFIKLTIMKKFPLFGSLVILTFTVQAQNVGIGTTSPNASAALEIKASTKGLLIPRTSTASRTAIANPAKGLMVYDTTSSSFWFHNGGAWVQIGTSGNGWSLTGNTATNPISNFLGTTDTFPLAFKVNNIRAGFLDNTTNGNVAFGYQSLLANATGFGNTANGHNSLKENISGNRNTGIGFYTLYVNTADNNTATGTYALSANTSGIGNVASGVNALTNNIAGNYNTATGSYSLQSNTGNENTATGASSLFSNTSGDDNTAIGFAALNANQAGMANTATGSYSLYQNTTGSYLTAIGNHADVLADGYTNSTALGNGAIISGSNMVQLGNNAVTQVFAGTGATATLITGGLKVTGGTLAAGNVLTSDATGVASWRTPSSSLIHFIGESYGGGIVFYITPDAHHGLIAETIDQGSPVNWYNAQDAISTASNHSLSAKNFTDWRLPTKNELNLLYLQKNFVGGFNTNYYWASTYFVLNGLFYVWIQNFSVGNQQDAGETYMASVRAIRGF